MINQALSLQISQALEKQHQEQKAQRARKRLELVNAENRKLEAGTPSLMELSPAQRAAVEAVWGRFPESKAELWVAYYAECFGQFSPYFIPDSLYYTDIDAKLNDQKKADLLDHKCYYHLLFPEARHPETVAMRVAGRWSDSAFAPLTLTGVMERCAFAGKVIVKPAANSCGGQGILVWNAELDSREQLEGFLRACRTDLILQAFLQQSEATARLHPESVNTLRLITFYDQDDVLMLSAVIRIGMGSSQVDNISAGGLAVGIASDGRLKEYGFSKHGKRFSAHPNGVVFREQRIPGFQEAVALVRKLHRRLPDFRLISWDIAFNSLEEPVLIEVNLKQGELDFHQMANGPLFGAHTEALLREVYGAAEEARP